MSLTQSQCPKEKPESAATSGPKPKPYSYSNQVFESATSCATMGVLEEFEGIEEDPTHTFTTEGELLLTFAGYFEELDMDLLLNPLSSMVLSSALPPGSSSTPQVLSSIKPVS